MSNPQSTASPNRSFDSDDDVDDRLPIDRSLRAHVDASLVGDISTPMPAFAADRPRSQSRYGEPDTVDRDELIKVNHFVWQRLTETLSSIIVQQNQHLVQFVNMLTGVHGTTSGYVYDELRPTLILGSNDARVTNFEMYDITALLQHENLMLFVGDLIRHNEKNVIRCTKLRRIFNMFSHARSVIGDGNAFSCQLLAPMMRPNQMDSSLIVAVHLAAMEFADLVASGRPPSTTLHSTTVVRDPPAVVAEPTLPVATGSTTSPVSDSSAMPIVAPSTTAVASTTVHAAELPAVSASGSESGRHADAARPPASVAPSVSAARPDPGADIDAARLEEWLSKLSTPSAEPMPKERKPQLHHDSPREFTDYYGGRFTFGSFGAKLIVLFLLLHFSPYLVERMGFFHDAGCELIRPPTCESYRISHQCFNFVRAMHNSTGEVPLYLPECHRVSVVDIGTIGVIQMYYNFVQFTFNMVFPWVMYMYIPICWLGLFAASISTLMLLAYNRPVWEAIRQLVNTMLCLSFLACAYYGPTIRLPDWNMDMAVKPWPERDAYYSCIRDTTPIETMFVYNWLKSWSWLAETLICAALAWWMITRRRVSYRLVGIDKLDVAPDVRPTSHSVVGAMYSSGLYATYHVTDWDHNPYNFFKTVVDGTFVRLETVSLEVAVSCLDPRIVSRDIRSEEHRVQLRELMCSRAGVENRVNIDRYTSAFADVHYATARFAYHYKMHIVRHLPSNFKCGSTEDLYALGYRVTEVKTKKAVTLRAGCKFRLRARQTTGRMVVQVHLGCGDLLATVPAPDRAHGLSLFVGACVRLASELPIPPDWFLRYVDSRLVEWLSGLFQPVPPHANFAFEKWLSTRPYTESRKNELRKARSSFPYMSNGPHNAFTAEGFIKAETYEGVWDAFATAMIDGDITDKVPRWICPTSDWTKAWIGPYISVIEHYIFSCPRFIKLIPGPKRSQYLFERLFAWIVEYLERDVTSAESHHNQFWVPIMYKIYCWMLQYNLDEEALWVLGLIYQTMVNDGQPTLVTKFFTILKLVLLKSGRMDTSMINVLLFMLIYDMQNAFRFGIDLNKTRPSLVLFEQWVVKFFDEKFSSQELGLIETQDIFEGDDSLTTAHDGKVLTDAMYREVGVKLESRRSTELTGTDFCGMIFDIIERIMITNIVAAYVNFGWASDAYLGVSSRRKYELIRARAYSLLYQYNSCPILHELALYALRATAHVDLTRFFRVRNRLSEWEMTQMRVAYDALKHVKVFPNRCGPRTRALVERLYGVTIEMQITAEAKLKSLKTVQVLNILPDTVFPTHWLTYNRDYVKQYSKNDIAKRVFVRAEIDCPKYYPFADDFFAKHGHQITGRNGEEGYDAVRSYLGL